jgi:hypothetical protein
MKLLFLIPLMAGLGTGYISFIVDQEIAYLTGTISFFSLILSLILAPWQIQFVILLLVIFKSRKLWKLLENATKEEEAQFNDSVIATTTNSSLSQESEEQIIYKYRGVLYQHPSQETDNHEKQGKYRGIPWQKKDENQIILLGKKPS